MITTTFENMYDEDGVTVVGKRLSYFYNGKFAAATEFPPETEMDEEVQAEYVAGKLGMLVS